MPAMMTSRLSTTARIGRRTKTPTQPPSSAVAGAGRAGSAEVMALFSTMDVPADCEGRRPWRHEPCWLDGLSGAQRAAAFVHDLVAGLQRRIDEDAVAVAREDGDVDALDGVLVGERARRRRPGGPIGWRAPARPGAPRRAAARRRRRSNRGSASDRDWGSRRAPSVCASRDRCACRPPGSCRCRTSPGASPGWRASACRSSSMGPPPPAP